jgi:hypothetical protein
MHFNVKIYTRNEGQGQKLDDIHIVDGKEATLVFINTWFIS